jgi:predicted membrane protein
VTTASFKGGDVTSILGGVELDFREADVAERPATININTLMGGVDIKVPESWGVDLRVSALLGGVADERKGRVAQPDGGSPHLVLTGLAIMGGVTIKS